MRAPSLRDAVVLVLGASLLVAGCGDGASRTVGETVPGDERTPRTAVLETGADLMQSTTPVDQISMYLVGFHPAKGDPQVQMESHHFCDQVNEDFAQCVLYDSGTDSARLHGIEYIISERLYGTLPVEERPYWHPHNYEILSGQLRMPGLPDVAEAEALRTKINSYGKTWHVWKTGSFGNRGDSLPLGPAHLAWSFNRDGEVDPRLIESRDARLDLDTAAARRDRAEWAPLANPQVGVDAMAGAFASADGAPEGVADAGDRNARGIPVVSMREP